jgi:hypothetical protein
MENVRCCDCAHFLAPAGSRGPECGFPIPDKFRSSGIVGQALIGYEAITPAFCSCFALKGYKEGDNG